MADGQRRRPGPVPGRRPQSTGLERLKKVYLAVPFHEKLQAKMAGALWDPERGAWYTMVDKPELRRWQVGLKPVQGELASDVLREFGAALQRLGCRVTSPHPIVDGRGHRIATEGDRPGRTAGFYVVHGDGRPAGYAMNFRTGEELRWRAGQQADKSEAERAVERAQLAARQAQRAQAQNRRYAEVAQCTRSTLRSLRALAEGERTPYLTAKGIGAHGGLYASRDGRQTYVPVHDLRGAVWTMQHIGPTGDKRFAGGGRMQGGFHALGGLRRLHAAASAPGGVVLIAEGYATAASTLALLDEQAGPVAAVSAFNAGNLPAVARALRARFPGTPILIAGDDDRGGAVNVGRRKALQAAAEVQGAAVFPPFGPQHSPSLSDWNDVHRASAAADIREAGRAALRQAVTEARARGSRALCATQARD